MSQPLAHTIFTLIQQLEPAAKNELMQLLAAPGTTATINDAADLTNLHVHPGGAIVIKEKSMQELNKQKKWSKDDFIQAVGYVKLPGNLTQFLTAKNLI